MIDSPYVTDEMLAAYIDGNATEEEILIIKDSGSGNECINEIIDICNGYTLDTLFMNDVNPHVELDLSHLTINANIDYDNITTIMTDNLNIDVNIGESYQTNDLNTNNDFSNLIDELDNMSDIDIF